MHTIGTNRSQIAKRRSTRLALNTSVGLSGLDTQKIQFTMPANRPGRLSEQQIAELLSYILKANGFPAGNNALPADADGLRGVVFFARNPSQ